TTMRGPSAPKIFGTFRIPAVVRPIENQFVVTDLLASKDNPFKIGDVVVSIDGEPLRARVDEAIKLLPASTQRARLVRALNAATRVKTVSDVTVIVKRGEATMTLTTPHVALTAQPASAKTGSPFEVLAGNIGYVDMMRLTVRKSVRCSMRLEKRKRSSSTSAVIRTEPRGQSRRASTRSRRRSARSFDGLSFHRSCRATGRTAFTSSSSCRRATRLSI